MRRQTQRRCASMLLLALSLLVLGTRVLGVHWHLCSDGLEKPRTLHWSEPGLADELAHAQASLRDSDLCIAADALANPAPPRLLCAAAVSIIIRRVILDVSSGWVPRLARPMLAIGQSGHFVPHLRGPPH